MPGWDRLGSALSKTLGLKMFLLSLVCIGTVLTLMPAAEAQNRNFSDSFDRSADTFSPPWLQVLRKTPESLVTDARVSRKGGYSAKMAVKDTDVPIGSQPRSQLGKDGLFCEGTEAYIADSIYLDGIPSAPWVMLSEHGFAAPWTRPPLTLQVNNGWLVLQHNGPTPDPPTYEPLVSVPAQSRQWMDTVMRIKFSKNPAVGRVEFWVNGQKVLGPTYRNTLNPDATACGWAVINNYRDAGTMTSYTLYHDEFKVGRSYSAVAP